MLSGRIEESTEKTSQSFEGQKVRSHYLPMIMCDCSIILRIIRIIIYVSTQ